MTTKPGQVYRLNLGIGGKARLMLMLMLMVSRDDAARREL